MVFAEAKQKINKLNWIITDHRNGICGHWVQYLYILLLNYILWHYTRYGKVKVVFNVVRQCRYFFMRLFIYSERKMHNHWAINICYTEISFHVPMTLIRIELDADLNPLCVLRWLFSFCTFRWPEPFSFGYDALSLFLLLWNLWSRAVTVQL